MAALKAKGFIFAAGKGTRLQPYTLTMPKALVPVEGIPMLERVVERFRSAGIDDVVINVHHFAEKIRDFLSANNYFGMNVEISDESDLLLDTGGALLKASRFFDDTDCIVVHNADILTDVDLRAMTDRHQEEKNDVTLLTSSRVTSRYLLFDKKDRRMCGWENTRTGETLPPGFDPSANENIEKRAFGGIHVISTSVLQTLKDYAEDDVFSIIPFYAASCGALAIRSYPIGQENYWFDIGSPEKLAKAEEFLLKDRK